MRIAMIGQKGMPAKFGGVERHVHDLALRLAMRKHEVTVYNRGWYATHEAQQVVVQGVQVVTLPTLKTKHLDTVSHTLIATFHAMKSDAEVLHYHGVGPALFSWIPRIFARHLRIITTFHSIDRKHKKWGFIARIFLRIGEWAACRFAHQTIAVSQSIQQYARDVYDAESVYIPNAVELPTRAETTNILNTLGLEKGKYILAVSRLIPHKGLHYAISAWTQMQEKYGYKLVIVGDGHYTDTYVEELKAQANSHSDIVFTGFQTGEPLRELFSHALVQIHPSDQEGLPLVVLEGMSYGLPVLVSDIIEHKGLVSDPEYRFKAGDVASLKKQLEACLAKNEDELWLTGESNRSLVATQYTWDKVMDVLEMIYCPLTLTPLSSANPSFGNDASIFT